MFKSTYLHVTRIIPFLFTLLVISSCSLTDVLDQEPPHALPSDHAIIDLQTAENALVGTYAQLPEAHIEFMGAYMTGLLRASSTGAGFVTNEIATNHATVSNYWSRLYRVVSASNGIIEQLPELTIENEERKKEIIGSARFLRAYANFELLKYFGRFDNLSHSDGIILRNSLVQLSGYEKARSTVSESYASILNDLNQALDEIPVTSKSHYVNKSAVQALMSRFYLFRAYADNDNASDLNKAIEYADLVINNPIYKLEAGFEQAFKKGLNSSEVIWGRFPDKTMKMKYNNYLVSPSPFVMYGPKLDSLLTGDPRKAFIMGTNPILRTKAIIKYYVNNQEIDETLYLIRLPEIFLIKAEAQWRLKKDLSECKTTLNSILTRLKQQSNATTMEQFADELFHHWTAELFLENGHEWFASIRFKQIEKLQNLKDKNKYIMPIPLKEMDFNSLMKQNNGY